MKIEDLPKGTLFKLKGDKRTWEVVKVYPGKVLAVPV